MNALPNLTLINGAVLTPSGIIKGGLRAEGGVIAEIGSDVHAEVSAIKDARGLLIAPGIIDLGVFSIDKPAFHFGGITRAALMPDQNPILDVPSRVSHIAKSGKPDLWVHPLAAATKGLAGHEIAEIALMRDAGAKAIATGRKWIADSGVMHRLMSYAAMLDMVVITHAEDAALAGSACATAGEMATRLGLPSAPKQAESLAVARDIALAELTGARLHLRQITTRESVALVRAAKQRGVPVTAGVTPAHFMLSDLAIGAFRTFARLSPPLRSDEDRRAIVEAIGEGVIDVISSGHDPRGTEDKRLPFSDAAPGMAGAETVLAMTLTLVRDDVISIERAFALLSQNPADILGVNAGRLEIGSEADIIIVDPEAPWVIDSARMAAQAGNTPFDNQPTQGRVTAVIKGGVQLVEAD